jgi:glycosyltransferase involved in cell wall biosynthesis
MRELRDRTFYRLGLRLADRIIVQTPTQQQMLADGFGYDSTVIPMPCPAPGRRGAAAPPLETRRTVLWVGRIVEVKRLDRLIELARLCPELQFLVIGPRTETDAHVRDFVPVAEAVPNITLWGPASREQLEALYTMAGVLCCTSDHEGFPNVFLEAWSHGLPVVSTWDPDAVIARHELGTVAADVPALAAAIRALLASEERWTRASSNGQQYFEQNHTVDRVMPRFERVLAEAAAGRRRARLRTRVAEGAAS